MIVSLVLALPSQRDEAPTMQELSGLGALPSGRKNEKRGIGHVRFSYKTTASAEAEAVHMLRSWQSLTRCCGDDERIRRCRGAQLS